MMPPSYESCDLMLPMHTGTAGKTPQAFLQQERQPYRLLGQRSTLQQFSLQLQCVSGSRPLVAMHLATVEAKFFKFQERGIFWLKGTGRKHIFAKAGTQTTVLI